MYDYSYPENGKSLRFDVRACIACGRCLEVCPHQVFESSEAESGITIRHPERCMECGACVENCPVAAITVRRGVGCAAAVINGMLRGTDPNCDCPGPSCCTGTGKPECASHKAVAARYSGIRAQAPHASGTLPSENILRRLRPVKTTHPAATRQPPRPHRDPPPHAE
ncbi:MAG: mercury methylation ferredoxin HgcB [Spirochaetes bacterium]|nr:mercury methylation ferredoxin HgcB [Spirochaetota bacterium]